MTSAMIHRLAAMTLVALGAWGLVSCGSSQQKMDLTPSSINTPPHRMSRGEYPFDAQGRYVDAWAAEGATRYGRRINSDRSDEERARTSSSSSSTRRATPPSRQRTETRKSTPPKKAQARSASHTVRKGDTLSSISRRYGASVDAIKRANGLRSNTIQSGRRLVIPR